MPGLCTRLGRRRPHLLTPWNSGRDLRQMLSTASLKPCGDPFLLTASCYRSHGSTLVTLAARQSRIPPTPAPSCATETKRKTPGCVFPDKCSFPEKKGESLGTRWPRHASSFLPWTCHLEVPSHLVAKAELKLGSHPLPRLAFSVPRPPASL